MLIVIYNVCYNVIYVYLIFKHFFIYDSTTKNKFCKFSNLKTISYSLKCKVTVNRKILISKLLEEICHKMN